MQKQNAFLSFKRNTKETDLGKIKFLFYLWIQIQNFTSEKDMVRSRGRARKLPIKLRNERGGKKRCFSHLSMCFEAQAFKLKFMNWETMRSNSC